jgi:hypothetical protein
VIDERASRALVAHVTRSAARHLVVVVALRNDAVFEAAVPRTEGELALYTSAAAEELLSGRQAVLERMRRAGVNVLDVSPQHMTAAVVNKYLEVKGRGALGYWLPAGRPAGAGGLLAEAGGCWLLTTAGSWLPSQGLAARPGARSLARSSQPDQ